MLQTFIYGFLVKINTDIIIWGGNKEMKKLLPLLVVGIFVLSGFGVIALQEGKQIVNKPLNPQDWELEILVIGETLGYRVIITNVGNETVNGTVNVTITTDTWFMFLGGSSGMVTPPWEISPGKGTDYKLKPVIGFGLAKINISGVFTHEIDGEYPFEEETGGIIFLIYVVCGTKQIIISP